jgi:NAD(P)-dependent dehydrogenase (short-subunit alcohol dehydrogenase family)
MKISGSVALVTGANRGLGRALARALAERGAVTVYAGARDPGTVTDPGLVPVRLDVTDPAQIAAAAARYPDVTLLVNNAGVFHRGPLLGPATLDEARDEMEINYFGTLALTRAFAPVLGANGGGALVNVLSVLSHVSVPDMGSYAASKSAAWSLTNGVRMELAGQGTQVLGVHVGFMDTDMAAHVTQPKERPEDVAARTLDALEAGRQEVFADEVSRRVKAGLSGDLLDLYPALRG